MNKKNITKQIIIQKTKKKIDYGYLFGEIVLCIFLIYWIFLNLNFKKFSLRTKRIINKIKYIIGSKKIVLDVKE